MAKFRSRVNYAQIYAGDKQGYNLGLDGSIFLIAEDTPRVFKAPRIGTQGSSIGDDTASTDISGGTDSKLKVNVDGTGVLDVTLVLTGLSTGAAIAAELEEQINLALVAAGKDSRVWVLFVDSDDHYEIYSQYTGLTSSVVVTAGATLNVADDLKLGVANGGTEAVGTDDQDFLLYTTGGPTFNQPNESNTHRSGRFHVGIVKKKKVAEFSFQTFVNMFGAAGASLDNAVKLLWKNLLGKETVTGGTSIKYEQDLPNFYMSMARVSTIFGEYYTGAYVKENTLTFAGDAAATCAWAGKASKRVIAGIAKINGAVNASATVIVDTGLTDRYDVAAPVMVVSPDGHEIVAGADGSLTIATITKLTNTMTLSAAITVADDGYVVPWHPGAVQQTGRDNIFTDLEGSFKLRQSGSNIDISSATLTMNNNHNDLDGYFGRDANAGFVAGQRLDLGLSVAFDLSNETFGEVVQTSNFEGFDPEIILGNASSGRYLRIRAKKWIPSVPSIEVPENGTTPVTLEGSLFQSAAGARDPITVEFL
jgi:hypothetical protein